MTGARTGRSISGRLPALCIVLAATVVGCSVPAEPVVYLDVIREGTDSLTLTLLACEPLAQPSAGDAAPDVSTVEAGVGTDSERCLRKSVFIGKDGEKARKRVAIYDVAPTSPFELLLDQDSRCAAASGAGVCGNYVTAFVMDPSKLSGVPTVLLHIHCGIAPALEGCGSACTPEQPAVVDRAERCPPLSF